MLESCSGVPVSLGRPGTCLVRMDRTYLATGVVAAQAPVSLAPWPLAPSLLVPLDPQTPFPLGP